MYPNKGIKENRSSNAQFLIPFLGGLIIAALAAIFFPQPITGKFYEFFVGSIVLVLWGVSGFMVFSRRELVQSRLRIKGNLAMAYGAIIMVICWLLALLFLYEAIRKIY